jgi:tetratricopeptide (TPR) repeat protein
LPNDLKMLFDEAVRLHRSGHVIDAEKAYRDILKLEPDQVDAIHLLGVLQIQCGRHWEGIAQIERAIALTAATPVAEFHSNIATGLRAVDLLDRAINHLKTVVTLKPTDADAHQRAGLVLMEAGAYADAAAYFSNAIALKVNFAEAHNNLGLALKQMGKYDEAVKAFRGALAAQPQNAAAHYNLGVVLKDMGAVADAAACFNKAAAFDPQNAAAQWNRTLAYLLCGDFAEGWKTFDLYAKISGAASRHFSQPAWDGGSLTGKTILLYDEHGYGDTLQFARYATDIAKQASRVVVQCRQDLMRLLATAPGVAEVVRVGDPLPPFDYHASFFVLPKLMATRMETIPSAVPYLFPPPEAVKAWQARGVLKAGKNAGVVWRGNTKTDPRRAVPIAQMAKIFAVRDFNWLSLQVGADEAEQNALADAGVQDCSGGLHDWADTAALISGLDVVVTIDTAVAHLAGALGKPVWVLLPRLPDWRWLLERRDSPWYPTARLFRQSGEADWDVVVSDVIKALEQQ